MNGQRVLRSKDNDDHQIVGLKIHQTGSQRLALALKLDYANTQKSIYQSVFMDNHAAVDGVRQAGGLIDVNYHAFRLLGRFLPTRQICSWFGC
jgi:hypothetical protein